MYNILIVDDKIEKINALIDSIDEIGNKEIEVEYELELKKACRSLENKRYDLLILDIQLPSVAHRTEVNKQGGLQLLQMITDVDVFKKPLAIIGLTAHDESYEEVESEFNNRLWHLIKYDKKTIDWKKQIVEKINYLFEAKLALEEEVLSKKRTPDVDCAIITAVPIEWESVYKCGLDWNQYEIEGDPTIYYLSQYEKDGRVISMLLVQQSQMGMVSASAITSKIVTTFQPRLVCMLGITGGCKGEVEIGDIIIANESWDYGSGKIKPKEEGDGFVLSPEPHQVSIPSAVREYFSADFSEMLYNIRKSWNDGNGTRQDKDIKIHIGALASGAAVVQDEKIVLEYILPQNRKVLGVDMETYAIYYAANNTYNTKPIFFSIKTVCDYANRDKNDKYQQYAAYVSTHFYMEIIHDIIKRI